MELADCEANYLEMIVPCMGKESPYNPIECPRPWKPKLTGREISFSLVTSLVCIMLASHTGVENLIFLQLTENRLPVKRPEICSGRLATLCITPLSLINYQKGSCLSCRSRPPEEPASQGDRLICRLYASLTGVGDLSIQSLAKPLPEACIPRKSAPSCK